MTWPTTETTLLLPGPAGVLETLVTPANNASQNNIAIVCHPHPLHGGTMNNKVVTMSCRALQQCGLATIRFNYRGVGKSEGEYGHFVGETADLLSIIDWVQNTIENPRLCLVGFSFCGYIAAQGTLQRAALVEQLITIAPAVNHADFNVFTSIRCPWVLIEGTKDEIVPLAEVHKWLAQLPVETKIKLVEILNADHFFNGKLIELKDIITREIRPLNLG